MGKMNWLRELCALLAMLMLTAGALAEAALPEDDIYDADFADYAGDVAGALLNEAEDYVDDQEDLGDVDDFYDDDVADVPDNPQDDAADAVDLPDDDAIEEDDLTGLWHGRLADGVAVVLELRGDETATLTVGKTVYEVEWVKEETIAYLAQHGSIVPITWDDQGLTLTVHDIELRMERVNMDLVGTWVAELEDEESGLQLNADGSCVMAVGKTRYNAIWSWEAPETVILAQGENLIRGVLADDTLTLPVGAFTLRFIRQQENVPVVP